MVAPRWAASRRPMQRSAFGRQIAALLWSSEPVVDWGSLDIATRNRLAKRATVISIVVIVLSNAAISIETFLLVQLAFNGGVLTYDTTPGYTDTTPFPATLTKWKYRAIYRVDDVVYATDNLCTHGHARLCNGFLDGHEIECPLHQGKFDVRDGQPTCAPVTDALRSYPVKVEGGRVFLQID